MKEYKDKGFKFSMDCIELKRIETVTISQVNIDIMTARFLII